MINHTAESLGLFNSQGEAPIHVLACQGSLEPLLPLLTPELLELRDQRYGATPAHYAACQAHLDQLLPVLSPELLSWTNKEGSTPVHYAAMSGGLAQILSLLTPELLSLKDAKGLTPVHVAAEKGNLAQLLPQLTAELLALRDRDGFTPVHEAARHGHLDQILPLLTPDLLSLKGVGRIPLQLPQPVGRPQPQTPNPNTPNLYCEEYTPLHYAAERGHLDQILSLLTPELLKLEDKKGRTPVHSAALCGNLAQILPLLTADLLSLRDDHGFTPLHYAAGKPIAFGNQPPKPANQLEALKPLLTRELCALEVNGVFVATRAVAHGQYAAISHLFPIEKLTCSEMRNWLPPVGPQGEFGTVEGINRALREHGLPESKSVRLASFAPSDSSPVLELPFAPGLTSHVSQGYDGIISHGWETAIDFDLPIGAPICAVFDGTVIGTKVDGKPFTDQTCKSDSFLESNGITICGPDGLLANYGHLDVGGVVVKPGETVKAGQVIGYGGNTGVADPHLHFETYRRHETNPDVKIPVPTWFRTSEGRTALQNGHAYTRPTPEPPNPEPPSMDDRLLPTERVPRLHKLLFHLPLVGRPLLRKWLSAKVNPGGVTRLHTLAAAGRLEPWLVDRIPDRLLSVPEELWGVTPIHAAALFGHLNQLGSKLTLARLTHQTKSGNAAAHLAAQKGHLYQIPQQFIPELLDQPNRGGLTPVHFAAEFGHLNQLLLWLTPDLLARADKYGDTPVHLAAAWCSIHQIAYLLTPALLGRKNDHGKTPIDHAKRNGQLEPIRHLLPPPKATPPTPRKILPPRLTPNRP